MNDNNMHAYILLLGICTKQPLVNKTVEGIRAFHLESFKRYRDGGTFIEKMQEKWQ